MIVVSLVTADSRIELQCLVKALTNEQKMDIERAARALNLVVRYSNNNG